MLRTRTEERKIEALLSKDGSGSGDLAALLDIIDLDRLNIRVEERADDFAAVASRMVRMAEPRPTNSPQRRVLPKLATAALAGVLVVGLSGVAVAADVAAPGDALYGIDRALESIGINNGGLDERIDEAQALADKGQSEDALTHLAESIAETSPAAAEAVLAAAEKMDNPSQTVLEDVHFMLAWMATTELTGREFGQQVAEMARGLGAGHDENPSTGRPENPGNAPEEPGNSPGGPEEEPGNSGEAPGNSGDPPGKSEDSPGKSGESPGNSGQGQDRGGGASSGNGSTGEKPGNRGP